MSYEPPQRPILPSFAAADITADILTPQSSVRSTMMLKAQSLASLLASDRRTTELAHPWFGSDVAETAVEDFEVRRPDPAVTWGTGIAMLTVVEMLVLAFLLA